MRALGITLILALAAVCPQGAMASLQPVGLSVEGGEESWHSEPGFGLSWSNPPEAVAAVHYRLLRPSGEEAIGETVVPWPATSLQYLAVPRSPGIYTAEVWLEDAAGVEGVPVSASLRFDDTRPGAVEPLVQSGWIGRPDFPYGLRLGHSAGAEPLSGIRGYALSIDGSDRGDPCADPYVCSEAETDLGGGADDDTLTVPGLPEGTSYAHAVAVSGSGMHSVATATVALRVDETDPATTLAGLPEGWSSGPVRVRATSVDAASGMAASGASGPFTAIRIDGGAPVTASGGSVEATVIGPGHHRVEYYGRDAAGNATDGAYVNGHRNPTPAAATVRIDGEAPTLAFLNAQDPRDPERIEVRASDPLSGLAPGGTIAVRRAGSGERFVPLPTDRLGGTLRARWLSESYPPGEYEFRATVHDRAGNAASTVLRESGSAMRLRSPLKVSTTLLVSAGRRDLSYGDGTEFTGRLLRGRRWPVAGAAVKIVERFDPGAVPRERVAVVTTSAGGRFSARLAPGPSREMLAVAAPSATARGASSEPLRIGVRSGVRLRVSAPVARVGGRPVVFSGRVGAAGTSIPAEGKAVQLQFRLPGLHWSEFRTIRTDQAGRFRYPYRFADDDSRGAHFQFRAYVPAQAGWPYQPAGSAPVTVRGV